VRSAVIRAWIVPRRRAAVVRPAEVSLR